VRTVYSTLLFEATSVEAAESVGGPPDGYLWVLRDLVMTYGDTLGGPEGAVSIGGTDPWLWLAQSPEGKYLSLGDTSVEWTGRIVIPAGTELWIKTNGVTADFYGSGYQLLVD
jgi:hypothetical protein